MARAIRYIGIALVGAGFILIALGLVGIYLKDGFSGIQATLSPFNIWQWIATVITLAPGLSLIWFADWLDRRKFESKANIASRKKDNDLEQIIREYERILGDNTADVVRDISELPWEKKRIKQAILEAISLTPEGSTKEHLKSAYTSLADFQDLGECGRRGLFAPKLVAEESQQLLLELKRQT